MKKGQSAALYPGQQKVLSRQKAPLSLAEGKEGSRYFVREIVAEQKERNRLYDLGLRPGEEVTVVKRIKGGVAAACFGKTLGVRESTARQVLLGTVPSFPGRGIGEKDSALTAEKSPEMRAADGAPPECLVCRRGDCKRKVKNDSKNGIRPVKIALLGTPNAGKSTVFNALTGGNARVGNYTGVTVAAESRKMIGTGGKVLLFDLPGTYSLGGYSGEERVSTEFFSSGRADGVVIITECAALRRNAEFIRQAVAIGLPAVVFLNAADEFFARGGKADEKELSLLFGVPVCLTEARNRKKRDKIRRAVLDLAVRAETSERQKQNTAFAHPGAGKISPGTLSQDSKASVPSSIKSPRGISPQAKQAAVSRFEKQDTVTSSQAKQAAATPIALPRAAYFFPERLPRDRFLERPKAYSALCLAVFFLAFYLAFGKYGLGEAGKRGMERLFSFLTRAAEKRLSGKLSPFLFGVLTEGILSGVLAVFSFLPPIAVLYLAVTALTESGVLARFAFFADRKAEKIGLSGRAVFSALLGFGCTAVATLSTRGEENVAVRKRTALFLPFCSCSARAPVYLLLVSAFFGGSFPVLVGVYAFTAALGIFTLGAIRRLSPSGEKENFCIEFPPYRFPDLRMSAKALLNYLGSFIIRVGGVVLVTVTALYVAGHVTPGMRFTATGEGSFSCGVGKALIFLFLPMGIADPRFAVAALSGLMAKEAVAGTLISFFGDELFSALTVPSALAYLTFLAIYPPCVASFSVTKGEFGLKFALLQSGLCMTLALISAYVVRFSALILWKVGWKISLIWGLPAGFAVWILRKKRKGHEKSYRKKKTDAESVV